MGLDLLRSLGVRLKGDFVLDPTERGPFSFHRRMEKIRLPNVEFFLNKRKGTSIRHVVMSFLVMK